MLVLGLSGRQLKDLDLFSKSDPYVVISRQSQPGGPWTPIRTSETIQNNLNPDWKDIVLDEAELGEGSNDDIQFEVFDDDGKPGKDRKDQSIGFVQTRVSQLRQGGILNIKDRKKGKDTGKITVRTFRRNSPGTNKASGTSKGGYPAAGGYPTPAPSNQGYPAPATGGYPSPGGGAYPGSAAGGFSAPGQSGIYPSVPPVAELGLPYPAQPPHPGLVAPYPGAPQNSGYPGGAPGGAPYPGGPSQGGGYPGGEPMRKTSQGLISQMQNKVTPNNSNGAGGFRIP